MRKISLLLILAVLLPAVSYGQHKNLNRMSKSKREAALFEIATEAMKKYAPSFYREDLMPVIEYDGQYTDDKSDPNYGRRGYQVNFPFDFKEDVIPGDDNWYGGYVWIWRDTGQPHFIMRAGAMVPFMIEEEEAAAVREGRPVRQLAPAKIPGPPIKVRDHNLDDN